MVITYLGQEFFKIQFGDLTIALNPISKDSKLKSSRFGADLALVSINHEDFNGVENVSFGERKPFSITGPGEYEIRGVTVKGFQGGKNSDGLLNTIYMISLEGMKLCFLGALLTRDIPAQTKSALEDIDILFTPIGGKGVLSASESYKLAVSLEPKIIIPMHYQDDSDGKTSLKAFLKEAGEEGAEVLEKLTIKKKDLEGKEGDVVVLSPASS